jgi:hypothetical protein
VIKPVQPWRWKRRISNASWLEDMIQLQKTLALCRRCDWAMPWMWKRKFHYAEMTAFHARGVCDRCRNEDAVSLYRSTDTAWYAQVERDNAILAEGRAKKDGSFVVVDRRGYRRY